MSLIKWVRDMLLRKESMTVMVILLLAVFIRIPVLMRNPIASGDGIASNLEVAENLRSGQGFMTFRKWTLYDPSLAPLRPEANRQPVLSFLLFLLFSFTGAAFLPAQLTALVIGLGCMIICWLWARRIFGSLPAMFMLLVLSIHPVFVWYSVQPDSLLLFTGLFFLILMTADREELSFSRTAALGALTGLAYLVRTQGLLLAFAIGIWVLVRGGPRRILKALLLTAVFVAVCAPWFIRNQQAFGSPLYSQNKQFLLNENHWATTEIRESAPSPTDMLRNQGPGAVASYLAKGVLRLFEPLTTGTLHRGEVFGQPSLIAFVLLALLALRCGRIRKRMLLPLIASIPMLCILALHEHSGRYVSFFVVIIIALGSEGLMRFGRMTGRRTALLAAGVLLFPFARPLGTLIGHDTRLRAAEAAETVAWIKENSSLDDWVVTYPNVELMIWDYRRPTLTMPNDFEMLLWPCLQEHDVRFVVVDSDLPGMRPHLSSRWRRTVDSAGWEIEDPPQFLEEVWRSRSGSTIIYEMTGIVPDGFMAVDSLPPDNYRALPPDGPH